MRFISFWIIIAATTGVAQTFDPEAGPSILSRGGRVGTRGSEVVSLNFSAGVSGIYDSSLGALVVTPSGINKQEAGLGLSVFGSLYGTHRWRRSSLGIDYQGSYDQFPGKSLYSGATQTIGLSFNKQHSKKLSTSVNTAAGTTNRSYGGIPGFSGYGFAGALDTVDNNFTAVPTQELFNNRVNYVQVTTGFVYQKSARLSFGVNASGSLVRREAKGLGGMNGYMGGANIAYRLSRRSTISVDYSFTHMEYPGAFGASDFHGLGASYSRSIGRDWQLDLGGMMNRVESLGLARVELDPLVASLLGQSSGVEAFYSLVNVPGFTANVTRRFRRGSLNILATQAVTPGNGLILTSRTTGVTSNYSYTGVRHWSLFGAVGYSKMVSLTRTVGEYRGVNAGVGASRDIYRTLHFTSRWDYRDQLIKSGTFARSGSRLSIGLAWSPRPVPLSVW